MMIIDPTNTTLNIIFTVVITILASGGFWALIESRVKDNKKIDEQRDMQLLLLKGLAHDRIISIGLALLQKGSMTTAEYENLWTYLYKPYMTMGGNGTVVLVMEEVCKLPVIPDGSYDHTLKKE